MYDKNKKCWVASEPIIRTDIHDSDVTSDEALYAEYALADAGLVDAISGTKNIDSVYRMEKTAKQGYAPACLAMAQMFEFGWAVAKSSKMALMWYHKAAEAGSAEAKAYLEKKKREKRKKNIIGFVITAVVVISAVLIAFTIYRLPASGELRITLPDGVELETPSDLAHYAKIIIDMQEEYDTEEMRSGDADTNRITLVYVGNNLNLSKFDIAAAASDGELTVLQFTNRDEALRCYEYLQTLSGTVAIDFDQYTSVDETTASDNSLSTASGTVTVYHSDVSGYDYYSWGAMAMELDQYAAYLSRVVPNNHVTVAVLDTGIEPNAETEDRIVDGIHLHFGGNGKTDKDSHGTHVSGIILNCTQGLNVDVMPVGVLDENGDGSTLITSLGLRYAVNNKVQVINMSLGGPHSDLKDYWVNEAINQGISVIVASGNEADLIDNYAYCPAHITQCITVGAMDISGDIGFFSNYGDAVDVCAPGCKVLSYLRAPDYFGWYSGTSQAAPHVAALAAMILLEYTYATPEQVERYIKTYSDGCGDDKQYYGEGMPLAGNFVENLD